MKETRRGQQCQAVARVCDKPVCPYEINLHHYVGLKVLIFTMLYYDFTIHYFSD